MAKHAQRRAGYKRQRRTLNPHKLRPFSSAEVAASFDRTKSLLQNYERLGLVAHVNAAAALPVAVAPSAVAAVLDADFAVPESITRSATQPKFGMEEREVEYLRTLVAKHGADFKRMERDIETNYKQESALRLEARVERMRRFDEERAREATAAALSVAASGQAAPAALRAPKQKGRPRR